MQAEQLKYIIQTYSPCHSFQCTQTFWT